MFTEEPLYKRHIPSDRHPSRMTANAQIRSRHSWCAASSYRGLNTRRARSFLIRISSWSSRPDS
jgi:hypothetical protein